MEGVERQLRLLAQSVAFETEANVRHRSRLAHMAKDLENYKVYNQGRFKEIADYLNPRLVKLDNIDQGMLQINTITNTTVAANFESLNEKYKILDASYCALLQHVHGGRRPPPNVAEWEPNESQTQPAPQGPAHFNISTSAVDPMQSRDPWGGQRLPEPAPAGQPVNAGGGPASPFGEPAHANGMPAVPKTFVDPQGLKFSSPFQDLAVTPPARDMRVSTPLGQPSLPPMYPGAFVGNAAPGGQVMPGGAAQNSQAGSFEISYKPNEALKKFTGDSGTYKLWADRMLDHLCRSNTRWRYVVVSLQAAPNAITRAWLEGQAIDGVSAWLLSEKLEVFICTWVSDSIYNRRVQMAGGERERGNGLEIWRQLFLEHHGGADAIRLGGMRRLQEWPRCSAIANLSQHLDAWVECLETHNAELLAAPQVLRSTILGVVPTEYEDEILSRPEVVTYQDIIAFCKKRTTYKRQKALSELTRKPGGKIASLIDDEVAASTSVPPAWATDLINAIAKNQVPPPPTPSEEVMAVTQARGRATGREPRTGTRSPSGRRAFNSKFRFKGCWHCGEEGHSRNPKPDKGIKGCPKFDKLKKEHGGKPPQGYKGA